jgi:hypothetical protein
MLTQVFFLGYMHLTCSDLVLEIFAPPGFRKNICPPYGCSDPIICFDRDMYCFLDNGHLFMVSLNIWMLSVSSCERELSATYELCDVAHAHLLKYSSKSMGPFVRWTELQDASFEWLGETQQSSSGWNGWVALCGLWGPLLSAGNMCCFS